jgi:hypothetical protein
MKRIIKTKMIYVLIAFLVLSKNMTFAQISDVGKFLTGGANDAGKILGAYIKPFSNAFGYSLNAGWYNTAKVHSLLGFDVTLTFNVAVIPTADKTFDVNALGLSPNANVTSPSIAQTMAGKTGSGPKITYTDAAKHQIISYNTPGGINLGFVPVPMIQAGLGLIKGTEIIGRFMPTVSIGTNGGTKIGMWGIGIKHSIKQWIPAIDDIPFLNISVMAGYSKLHFVSDLSLNPNSAIFQLNSISFTDTARNMDFSTQQLDFMVKSFTANALVSLDFPFITLYGGIGISSTSTDFKMLGNYIMPQYNISLKGVEVSSKDVKTDPNTITLKGGTKPRLNIGFKLKLGLFAINADYTYANYSIATVGIGIGFR